MSVATVATSEAATAGAASLVDPPPSAARGRVAIFCVLASMVLVVLDAAITNVALPAMAKALGGSADRSVWIVTAYQTGLLMALLPCAALGERRGYRRVFTGGVAVFLGASALCGAATSLWWLVAARFAQGLGGAAILALGVAILRFVVPAARFGDAVGWNALAVALAGAAGPTLGAAILGEMSWPWLFWLNLAPGALVLASSRALPPVAGTGRRMDWMSVGLLGAGFACLVLSAEMVAARPVAAGVAVSAAGAALAGLVRREGPKKTPLIPLDLLRAAGFRSSVVASVCCFAGVTAGLVALPFYLQQGLGRDAWVTGLVMTPWPLSAAVAAAGAGRLADRIGTGRVCAAGALCLAVGLAGAAVWPVRESVLPLGVSASVCGLGFGMFQVPNNRNLFLAAPVERSGAAGGMQGTARLAGQTAGAVAMTVLFGVLGVGTAPTVGLVVGALLALGAAGVSWTQTRLKSRGGWMLTMSTLLCKV